MAEIKRGNWNRWCSTQRIFSGSHPFDGTMS